MVGAALEGMQRGVDLGDRLMFISPGSGLRWLGTAAVAGIVKRKLAGAAAKKSAQKGGGYVVYQAVKNGVVQYIGITSQELIKRANQHYAKDAAKRGLIFGVVEGMEGLTKKQARVADQKLINQYGLGNLLNRINSVAEKYWTQLGI